MLDLGTNAGKASLAIASGFANHEGKMRSLFCCDPVFDLTNREAWSHSIQGKPENCGWAWVHDPDFNKKVSDRILAVSNARIDPQLVGDYSTNAIPKYGPYAWAFIDSDDHAESLIREELALLKDRMVIGGIIGFHDFGNYPAVERVMREFLSNGCYEEVPIDWGAIREYVEANNLERGNDSWHCPQEALPCHVAAIKRIK